MSSTIILAFDLYGTLVSTASIAKALSRHVGEGAAEALSASWRTLQLEYTWRLNSMQTYEPFSTVTERSLKHALRIHGHELAPDALQTVLADYDVLSTFSDVEPALTALNKNPRFHPVIFSNGTPTMIQNSMRNSVGISSHAATFKDIVSANEIARFKPSLALYRHLAKRVGMRGREDRIWLVSGNPFDVVGARSAGLQAAWVNRDEGKSWDDQLEEDDTGKPTIEVRNLEELVEKIEAWSREHQK